MSGVLHLLATAPSDKVLFVDGARIITAGHIRAAARRAAVSLQSSSTRIFLHTESASLMCAGLVAGAIARRPVAILPHAKANYLEEIGADAASLLIDTGERPMLAFAPGDDTPIAIDADLDLLFFTSGSTGAPKQVVRRLQQLDAEGRYWVKEFAGRLDHVAGTVSHLHMYGMTFRIVTAVMAGWRSEDRQDFGWETFAAKFTPGTLAVTSPAHLTRIPEGLSLTKGAPGVMLSAGQLLPLSAAATAAKVFGKPPLEIYGSTEVGAVARRQRSDVEDPWTPLAGMELNTDENGVLVVQSPFLGEATHAMGDRVELLRDGRFQLLGRADGVVKIAGKRVSLARVEQMLRAHPDVRDAAVVTLDGAAGMMLATAIVLEADAGGRLARLGAFRFSRDLRRNLADSLEPAELPKRWRFVGRIPSNSQGKRSPTTLAALFKTPPLSPTLGARIEQVSENAARLYFRLAPDLAWFEGHFPDRPILAGIAQVHIAVRLAEEIWGFLPENFRVSRLKFRRVLQPGDDVVLDLARDTARGRLSFAFESSGTVASEGAIGA